MIPRGVTLAAILLCATVTPSFGQRIEVIEKSGLWVTDRADMLSPSEESLLSTRLSGFADTTSTQIVIVTIPSLDGVEPVEYAVALGREWGVGQEGRDNGVVILVSRDDRQLFIAPGYGLEGSLPDALASTIVRRIILPRFKEGAFYQGLSDGVDAVMLAVQGEFAALPDEGAGSGDFPIGMVLFVILVIVFFVLSDAKNSGKGTGNRRRHSSGPVIIWGGGFGGGGGGGFGGGFGGGGFGGGGFGGGGGSFGGGGAGGGW